MKKQTKKLSHSKRYVELKDKVEKNKLYPLEEAIKLIKETATTKFDSTVEISIRTGIDPKKTEQQVRSTVLLPHGSGKKMKIAVVASPEKQKEAKAAGAEIVGGEELIEQIAKTQKTDFDVLLTTPDLMKDLAKIAKVLGPKGLMPSPKTETVTPNIKKAVEELAKGKMTYRNDDTGNIHLAIGKASYSEKDLQENYKAFLEILQKNKPSTIKGIFIKGITLSSTMGPGIKIQL